MLENWDFLQSFKYIPAYLFGNQLEENKPEMNGVLIFKFLLHSVPQRGIQHPTTPPRYRKSHLTILKTAFSFRAEIFASETRHPASGVPPLHPCSPHRRECVYSSSSPCYSWADCNARPTDTCTSLRTRQHDFPGIDRPVSRIARAPPLLALAIKHLAACHGVRRVTNDSRLRCAW